MAGKIIKRRDFLRRAATAGAAAAAVTTTTAAAVTSVGAKSLGARVRGANDRVRLGVIGPGARAQEMMKGFLRLPQVEFVAVADVYTRRLEEAKRLAPGVKTFTDHRRLLDEQGIDAVIVASPLHCHARHFLDTLAAGRDLYCEKTMTWSIAEADACRLAARRSNRVVGIGLQYQSSGDYADARRWIKDGLPGKITQVEAWMSRNTRQGVGQWVRPIPPDCTPGNVRWDLFLNGRPQRPFDPHQLINWRLYWDYSGGNVTENMVHQIAFIMGALDLPVPAAAYMSGGVFSVKDGREVPDTIAVTLDFPNDLVVTWQSTFSNSQYGSGERFLGSHGTIERLAGSTDMVTGKSRSGIHYFPEKVNRPDGIMAAGEAEDQNHFANFIDCVRTRKEPNASVEIGYRSAVAAHMANLSYRRKERVTLDAARRITDSRISSRNR